MAHISIVFLGLALTVTTLILFALSLHPLISVRRRVVIGVLLLFMQVAICVMLVNEWGRASEMEAERAAEEAERAFEAQEAEACMKQIGIFQGRGFRYTKWAPGQCKYCYSSNPIPMNEAARQICEEK